jgi:acyl carrier protein
MKGKIMSDLNRAEVLKIIEQAFREVAGESDIPLPDQIGEETRILGGDSPFDSMHVVNVIVLVEEGISDAFDLDITLANEHTMSQSKSPFRSIGTLSDYIVGTLK